MLDINFYRKIYPLQKSIMSGDKYSIDFVKSEFEKYRSPYPVVYNIETTNACNMKCKMCPRTTMMTRKVETLDMGSIINISNQIRPWTAEEWGEWKLFVKKTYGVEDGVMSENHFFLYVIPNVLQLHGYGDPLLDKNIVDCVRALSDKGFLTYFSCNPSNIDVRKTHDLFRAGLSYIKYSIESVDDIKHKEIRGSCSDFTESYNKIKEILDFKKINGYNTIIVITMLDLNNNKQEEEYLNLKKAFENLDVYVYLKSQDQQWYGEDGYRGTNSIHWSEICKHPWMTMTIKSNGEVAMCMEDYNNEIILGNISRNSLYDIWNGEKYKQFRDNHFLIKTKQKCTEECDMKTIGRYFS